MALDELRRINNEKKGKDPEPLTLGEICSRVAEEVAMVWGIPRNSQPAWHQRLFYCPSLPVFKPEKIANEGELALAESTLVGFLYAASKTRSWPSPTGFLESVGKSVDAVFGADRG